MGLALGFTIGGIITLIIGAVWIGLGSELGKSFYSIMLKDKFESYLNHIKNKSIKLVEVGDGHGKL